MLPYLDYETCARCDEPLYTPQTTVYRLCGNGGTGIPLHADCALEFDIERRRIFDRMDYQQRRGLSGDTRVPIEGRCSRGHLRTEHSAYRRRTGEWVCRICRSDRRRQRREKAQEAAG